MIQRLYRGVPWASKPTRRDNYPAGNIDADNTGKVLGFRLVRNLIDTQGDDRRHQHGHGRTLHQRCTKSNLHVTTSHRSHPSCDAAPYITDRTVDTRVMALRPSAEIQCCATF